MIQPREITNEIKKRPPLQRKAAEDSYCGIKISWKLSFFGAREVFNNHNKWGINAVPENDLYPDVYLEVDKLKYPEFNIIHENTIFWVEGEISEVRNLSISLINVVVRFTEENKDSQIKNQSIYINSQIHTGVGNNIKEETLISSKKSWYEKPIGIIVLAVIAGLILGGILYFLKWN